MLLGKCDFLFPLYDIIIVNKLNFGSLFIMTMDVLGFVITTKIKR